MGGSVLAQVWQQMGSTAPDVAPEDIHAFFKLMKSAKDNDWCLPTTITLMAACWSLSWKWHLRRCGLQVDLNLSPDQANTSAF